MKRNILFSFINITGLSIAFTCCLLIFLYVNHEFSHDKFHKNRDNIYKTTYSIKKSNASIIKSSLYDYKMAEKLKNNVPQIIYSSPFRIGWGAIFKHQGHTFIERLGITEPDFLKIFSFPLIEGNIDKVLLNPNEIVITKSFASKLLDEKTTSYHQLIGEQIEILNIKDQLFTITGILDEIPKTSSITFDVLIHYDYQKYFAQASNSFGNSSIYIELDPKADAEIAEINAEKVIKTFYENKISQLQSDGYLEKSSDCFQTDLLNLSDLYFATDLHAPYASSSSKTSSIILSIIALIILLTASINYLLLSSGQALRKAYQIGLLKVFGSTQRQIILISAVEAFLLNIISLFISIVLASFLYPYFEELTFKQFNISLVSSWLIPGAFISILFFIIIFIVSPFLLKFINTNTILLLKKQILSNKKSWLSNSFVTFQYFISIFLIFSTIIILRQTYYMKHKSLGFNAENIIKLKIPANFNDEKTQTIKEELLTYSNIISVSGCDKGFMGDQSSYNVRNEKGENNTIRFLRIDNDFINTLELTLVDGNNITEANLTSTNDEVLVNEKLLSSMNISKKTGSYIEVISWNRKLKIKGIVKDFHFDSMKDKIQPLLLIPNTNYERISYLFIKYQTNQSVNALSILEETWNKHSSGEEMSFSFLNEELASRYGEEDRWGKIAAYSAILAIFIASLGLFGLTLVKVNKRIKEIGIRKVNGAGIKEIMVMLNKNFLSLILLSFVLATPLAYFLMNKWLENFDFKATINSWIFVLTGIIVLIITLLTVNWQCWNAARKNPIEALKYE
ncbi:ABC transporter permease [Bacteroidota bacterium]